MILLGVGSLSMGEIADFLGPILRELRQLAHRLPPGSPERGR
jgi:hypothetical protein